MPFSFSEQAAQLVFPAFQFDKDDTALAEQLVERGVGGFCLYGGKAEQVASFIGRLQPKARIPLLFCADYEDGTASHVQGGTLFPCNMALGASGQETLAYQKGLITAIEARALGVRWVLAPVLDLATCPENPIVNVRAFGAEPELVSRLGLAYMQGLQSEQVLSCAKHFPGHGETRKDSHLELPSVTVSRAQLFSRELLPFKRSLKADAVMLAHLRVPAFRDERLPASLSPDIVQGLLRKRWHYPRLLVSDALTMRAVSQRYEQSALACLALKAGLDILLAPIDAPGLLELLPSLTASNPILKSKVRASFQRLQKAKRTCGLLEDHGQVFEEDMVFLGHRKHQLVSATMARAALTWVGAASHRTPLPREISYLEPESSGTSQWKGKIFLAELRRLGVRVISYAGTRKNVPSNRPLVIASFLRPRAYTGRICYAQTEGRRSQAAIRAHARSLLVSFGSPFVFDQLKGYGAGLCAFSGCEASQRAAALALKGLLDAPGRMPVKLNAFGVKTDI